MSHCPHYAIGSCITRCLSLQCYQSTMRHEDTANSYRAGAVRSSTSGKTKILHNNWENLTQDQWVLEAIQGYRVPFTHQPTQPHIPRALYHSSEEEEMVQAEIQSMLEKHAIIQSPQRGWDFLSTIFLVPKKDRGQRPVINLKALNKFVTSRWRAYTSC